MNASKGLLASLALLLGVYGPAQAALPFAPDAQPVGHVGQPAITSPLVAVGGVVLYSIDYNVLEWSGNLHAYSISTNGIIDTETDLWDGGAAGRIEQQDWNTERMIVTVSGAGAKVPFRWANLTAADRAALDPDTAGPMDSPVLNFIRGDRSNEAPEGKAYRARASVLGDIMHSGPVYCPASLCGGATVFVGANDGMLHAIDAANGSERFAYIPSMVIPRLGFLKADPYTHKYFVDGGLALKSFGSKTILAGALGAGGKGLFALDVSNAVAGTETDAASKILWEVSNATSGFANLGDTYGKPVLASLPGAKPVLIAGNGYNNTGNGHATLYVINANTGALLHEIDTNSGSAGSPNGLSSPTVVYDNDGYASIAYAGDIDGNLWKFDLVDGTASPLHTTDPAQAITMAPGVRPHPNGGHMVTFVTGRLFTAADETDMATHYAYGIWDRPAAYGGNNAILEQTLSASTWTDPANGSQTVKVRTATAAVPNWSAGAGNHKGWKTALPVGGERVVGDGAYVSSAGQFVFLSTNPTSSPSATPPGENWWMQLNALTGGDNGLVVFDLNNDKKFTSVDEVAAGKPVGRYFGGGVRSQLIPLTATGVQVAVATYDKNGDPPVPEELSDDKGVAGGHFDFDIYCYSDKFCKKAGSSTKLNGLTCNSGTNGCTQGTTSTTYVGATTSGVTLTNSSTSKKTNIVNTKGTAPQFTHTHQYDDIFDVTGVDMLNASQPRYNLVYPVSSTSTKFKILVANQAYSPAVWLNIGGEQKSVISYGTSSAYASSTTGLIASLPTYVRATTAKAPVLPIKSLVVGMPVDAFEVKDWGTGVVRAGLHPTSYNCVVPSNIMSKPLNEWRNGALTIQIIKDTTKDTYVRLNVAGRPDLGYRLKDDKTSQDYLLAEYTIFWHNPTLKSDGTYQTKEENPTTFSRGQCMGSAFWSMAPPKETTSHAPSATPAPGSTDPKEGSFVIVGGGGTGSGEEGQDGEAPGDPDGSGSSDNDGTSTGVTTGGQVQVGGEVGGVNGGPDGGNISSLGATGRVNWRELRQ
jgi:Tfp pilus tip-associated adhesin PilY1